MLATCRSRISYRPKLSRGFATPISLPIKDCTSITPDYPRLLRTLDDVRHVLPRDTRLTLAEKILYAHLKSPEDSLGGGGKVRGERYLKLRPDRVAMQVSKACMNRLSFSQAKLALLKLFQALCWTASDAVVTVGCFSPDGAAPIHDLSSPILRRPHLNTLRSPHPSSDRRSRRSLTLHQE